MHTKIKNSTSFVIAHFHPKGKVEQHLKQLIKYINKKISKKIVLVSTNITPEEVGNLSKYCKVISRENYGYDFWSYKIGNDEFLDDSELSRIVFFNSSFICLDPKILCNKALPKVSKSLIRGLTFSTDKAAHLQSFWISFEGKLLINSNEYKSWWKNMIPISDKSEVIEKYELGMSQYFINSGFDVSSVYKQSNNSNLVAVCRAIGNRLWALDEVKELVQIEINAGLALNPTHYLWDEVLENLKIIKHDLLKNNPTKQDMHLILSSLSADELILVEDALVS